MNKLLIISGPTATGKTKTAFRLAKIFDGELISADSRQVYKHMDIVTGKDVPEKNDIKIWGYSVLSPNEDANASWYANYTRKAIADIWKRGKLPILVGGTGFYINALLGKYPFLDIPQNKSLRKKMSKLSTDKLYDMLLQKDPSRAKALNNSDSNNKRRLIRALEIADYSKSNTVAEIKKLNADILWIGLKLPADKLKEKITRRVNKRLGPEMDAEIAFLKNKGFLKAAPARTLGYQQWIEHLNGNCTIQEAIQNWITAEYKYAKRQLTWFNKQPEIIWFNAGSKALNSKLSVRVRKWYS